MEQTPVISPEEEARSLSGTLKDLLGQVHEQLGKVDQELKVVTAEERKNILLDRREDLLEARADLEEILHHVNGQEPNEWQAIRSEANEIIDSINEDLDEIRSTDPAMN